MKICLLYLAADFETDVTDGLLGAIAFISCRGLPGTGNCLLGDQKAIAPIK